MTGVAVINSWAQVPSCDTTVPYNIVNLVGHPNGVFISPPHSRNGNCCSTTSPDRCTSFDLILDTNAAMVNFNIYTGAVPPGALFYQIDCDTPIYVGHPICITGGSHHMTFCKPGNNTNTYIITSIPKPIFPKPDSARFGCSKLIPILGLDSSSITWNSVSPGTRGRYNSYMHLADTTHFLFTPGTDTVPYIDYEVCGTPIAVLCGFVHLCDTIRVYIIPALTASVTPTDPSFCTGGTGTVITAHAAGGDGHYSYIWTNGSGIVVGTGVTYTATSGGTYKLEVRDGFYDSSLCTGPYVPVSVSMNVPPVMNAGPDQILCASSPTAYLAGTVLHATGGIWSGGAGTYTPSPDSLFISYTPTSGELTAGFARLILTSTGVGSGCVNTKDTVILHYPPLLQVRLDSVNVPCATSTGTLTPVVTGGIGSYAYHWGTGAATSSITGRSGTYCVYVTDSIGCIASACTNIYAPAALSIAMSSTDISAHGATDGTATATVSGGTPAYTYAWSTGATAVTITGRGYGVYSVVATDSHGCTISGAVVVSESRCAGLGATMSSGNVWCYGGSSGIAIVVPSGGTAPYSFLWNDPYAQTNDTATGLTAGLYSVLITDSTGCMNVESVTITQPSQLINTMTHTNVAIIGDSTGTATANPTGGTSPYSYSWSNGRTTATNTGLVAGWYRVTITDVHECTYTDSVRITQPPCNTLALNLTSSNVSCYGGANGSAAAHVYFGHLPYRYVWSTTATTSSISGLSAGPYSITVNDSINCSASQSLSITQPSALSISLAATDITCFQYNNGSIDLSVTGGTFPYSFSWSNGINVEDQVNLTPGTYSVTVTDANGCTATGSATILRPDALTFMVSKTDVTCYGGSDGSIRDSVAGGMTPYAYSWSTGATTRNLSSLSAGSYTVTVIDYNGCQKARSVIIDQPDSVHITSITANCPAPDTNVAYVTVAVAGGTGSYRISYDNGATYHATGDYHTYLVAGTTYHLWAKDSNNCISRSVYNFTPKPKVTVSAVAFANCFSSGVSVTTATVTPAGGAGGSYRISFDSGATFGSYGVYTQSLAIATTYKIVAKDSFGCISAPTTINIPDTLHVSDTLSAFTGGTNISCHGAADGYIHLSVSGGKPPYTFVWSNGATTQNISGLTAGTYSVTVTDGNSCNKIIRGIVLSQPATLTASGSTLTNVSCNGGNNGSVSVTPGGGTTPYTYSWSTSPVQTTSSATGLTAGTYTVTVTDAHSCTATSTATVTQPATLTATGATIANVSCNGGTNGSVRVTPAGGTAPYTYSWSTSPVQTTSAATGLTFGTYTVTVTDSHSCTATATATVTQPTTLTATGSTLTNVSCNGGNNGSVSVTPGGGTTPYTYSWSTSPVQTTSAATGLTAGTYTVTVTDSHSCTATSTATVTQPTTLTATGSTLTNVSCNGGSNGSVSVTPGGGTTPYTYSWSTSPAQTTSAATGLTAGTYTVTVTDSHSCTATSTATVTQPTTLTATASTLTNTSCNGVNDGSVTVSAGGGTTPYTYSWSTSPVQTTSTATGLIAGSYTVTVTDAHSCTAISTATVTQPSTLSATASTLTNVSCNGGNNGSVRVTPTGGTTPYTYSWSTSPIQTTSTATGLTAGTYTVIVADSHSCTATATATVTQPTTLTATGSTLTNVSCNGGNNGSISVTPGGGTTPYTYSWSTSPVQTTSAATGLTAGTYTVTVTDSHSCTAASTATVTQPTTLTATGSTLTNVSCNGGNNGSVSVTPGGGTTPYTYSWSTSPAQTTSAATGLTAGTYTVTVTDAHSCTATSTATVTQPTTLTATGSTLTNVSCNGGNNGSVSVTPGGGTTPYTYSWSTSPVQTTSAATGLTAGTYTVTVTDSHSCTATSTATVTQPTTLTATGSTLTNVSCNGGSNGSVSVTPGGGTTPYTYSWSTSPIQTTSSATGLTAGTYTVTVTDARSCTATSTATVTQPTTLTATGSTLTNVSCNGGNNGSVSVTPGGGTTPYTYSWSTSPIQTTSAATGLTAGTYTVTVTDSHSCTATSTATVTQPTTLTATGSTLTNVSCNGGNNGSVSVTPGGGTTPYTYSWSTSPAQTTSAATGLTAATYTVTVTDAHNCTAITTATVTQPTTLTATASTLTNTSCNGVNDGSVTVSAGGGTTPYTYSWSTSPVQTTSTATGLIAGSYTVIVTDAHSCTATSTATVTQPSTLSATASTVTNVSCNGGNNGSASVIATGGTTPYTYSWNTSPVQTTTMVTGLSAGTYMVTVTDAHSCSYVSSATIVQPTTLTASSSVIADILCNGGANGLVSVSPAGGTMPYTYSWSTSPVQTTSIASNLTAGSYTVTVTDAHSCVAVATATVTQPAVLTTTAGTLANVLCNGGNNGSVTATPAGGTLPYTYSWSTSPVQTTSAATGLIAGTYTVTVTDAHSCVASANTTVTQPTVLLVEATAVSHVSCNGANNGSVTVTVSGGTSPYTYNWSTSPIQTTATASNLTAGTYTVTVTDAHGCVETHVTIITQPLTLISSVSAVTNVSCNGGNNGSASVTPLGGTTPYTYSWSTSPAQTTSMATGLTAGTYTVTVTDAHSCYTTTTAVVSQPATLTATASTVINVLCNGGNNGSVNVTAGGGTLPYVYSWSTSPVQTTSMATGLIAGAYSVTVTDAHGCSAMSSANVTQPATLTAAGATLTNVSCNGGNNGSASVTPAGGTLPYTYSWNTSPVQTTSVATGLGSGSYTVTVTDAHSCTAIATATITQPTTLTAAASTLTNVSCNSGNNGSASVTPAGGSTPYTYSWSTSPVQTTSAALGLTAGTYTATVTDAHGCIVRATATVTQPVMLTATAATITNVSCNGGNNGSASVTSAGGTLPYTYSWNTSPVQTTATATGLAAGIYTVTVTDAHTCVTTASATITQPATLAASASTLTNVSCNGGNNGSVSVTPSGGTTPYVYSWNTSPVQATAIATGLIAGVYTATVTDAHGCNTTAFAAVTQPSPLNATAATLTNVLCNGGNNGSVSVTAGGGTVPYTYRWSTSPVQTTATATGLTAGTYTVTVTDAHACVISAAATVTQPATLTAAAATLANASCNGVNNGSVTVTAGGGTTPYTYSWNTSPVQTTATATGLIAGIYTVTVADAHGCTATSVTSVTQPALLTASSVSGSILCNGGATTVRVTATGGTTPYTGIGTYTVTAGTYSYMVTDAHGCTGNTTITVTEPTPLRAVSASGNILCNGGATTITVSASGGTTPYAGIGTFTVTAGTYSYTVTDGNDCIASTSITVSEPTRLTAASTAGTIRCYGETTTVTVTAAGGTAPFAGVGIFTVTAGTHNYVVTDANGCSASTSITISQPTQLIATSVSGKILCSGGTTTVVVTAAGGTTPYAGTGTYTVPAGIYNYTITDGNGCSAQTSISVIQPVELTLSVSATDATCTANNGTATAVPAGGTAPYTYQWDAAAGSQVTATATGLRKGAYSVAVTDDNGCTQSAAVTVNGEISVIAVAIAPIDPSCYNGSNGAIALNITGGTQPYSFSWSNGSTAQNATELTAGDYTVSVTDGVGCTASASVTIGQPSPLAVTLTPSTYANGYNLSAFGSNDGSVRAEVTGGTVPYTYLWSNSSTSSSITNMPAGDYSVVVTDNNGCVADAMIALKEAMVLDLPTGYSPNGDGLNDFFVIHGIDNYPDNKLTVFNRWGDEVYAAYNYHNTWNGQNNNGGDLPDGTYFIILKINGGSITRNGYVDLRR
jgi:gliding motility-associated-like protein